MKHPIIAALAVLACLTVSVAAAREWTDITGKFKIDAEFVSFQDGMVELRKSDGNPIKVPLEKLSDDDLKSLRDRPEIAVFLEGNPDLKQRASGFAKILAPAGLESGIVCRFKRIDHGPKSMDFSKTGRFLAVGRGNDGIDMFDLTLGNRVSRVTDVPDLREVNRCRFTPDGKKLLATGTEGVIHVWDVAPDGELKSRKTLVGHRREVTAIAFSSNSVRAISGCKDGKVIYWEIDSGRKLATFSSFKNEISACYITPNGQQAMVTDGAELKLFDLSKSSEIESVKLGWFSSRGAVFSPNGRQLVIFGDMGVNIRDVATGEGFHIKVFGLKYDFRFTSDGTRMISFESNDIRIWDAATGDVLSRLDPTVSSGPDISALSPDDRHIAIARTGNYQDVVVMRLAED
ncbi:hypothetical protein C5Y96_15735 [Blastopirellula marina]|uniref:Serine-threonine kinase receptor-associated protein n=1 Tax=Blastopirellula marina TaxID=124 RepID=A0A2S8FAM6_9BACT|nr:MULTISPECIES: SHD1 domain-containing protein [Pirellulaceae]PQO29197.1 hypothetical protein C5Y96_15735 [Blastopirellula marina]RCS50390.1 hypothetical protein DTL36_15755 [Bremerella cremea]